QLNLRTREWSMRSAKTELTPELLQHGVLGSIYAQGGLITGERGHVRLQDTRYTTCDLARPHYFFRAKSVDIYPGDKMVVRRATLVTSVVVPAPHSAHVSTSIYMTRRACAKGPPTSTGRGGVMGG